MRTRRLLALATLAVASVGGVLATAPPVGAQTPDPAGIVATLDTLWAEEQGLRSELDAATAERARLDEIGTKGRRGAARVAVADAAIDALEARHAAITQEINTLKAALAGRPAPAATPTVDERAANIAADPRWAAVYAAMDAIPYPVETLGARIVLGHHPALGPAWGAYDRDTNHIYVGDAAFATDARLRYVVAHELAHAYEEQRMSPAQRAEALALVRASGARGAPDELFADAIAALWGAGADAHYFAPPLDLVEALAPYIR